MDFPSRQMFRDLVGFYQLGVNSISSSGLFPIARIV
jgi:hypothetical protein